jgi:hypothetical protein
MYWSFAGHGVEALRFAVDAASRTAVLWAVEQSGVNVFRQVTGHLAKG